jgi:aspartate aminotransferase-like enzyme
MVPPGFSFNAISEKALAANAKSKLPKSYWNWDEMLKANTSGFFPYTPATNLLYGLREALRMLTRKVSRTCSPPHAARRGDPRGRSRLGLDIVPRIHRSTQARLTAFTP